MTVPAYREQTDILVIGSGIAGLSFALKAAKLGTVTVVTKKAPIDCNTNYAQGGIAGVLPELDTEDSYEAHIEDTMESGAFANDPEIVEMVVKGAAPRIRELIARGVSFSSGDAGGYDLGREGGHSYRRVFHARDLTGAEIEDALLSDCAADPNITLWDNAIAIDLITRRKIGLETLSSGEDECLGAYIYDREANRIATYRARVTVLATGGCGQIYLFSTNPSIATGDGIAMAYRVGAQLRGLEFVQFHPTSLYHHKGNSFLISEAVRGEGGVLLTQEEYREYRAAVDEGEGGADEGEGGADEGEGTDPDPDSFSFMHRYDDRGSLATRDIAARAIDRELKRSGDDCVYLTIEHRAASFIKDRFPHIYSTLKELDIDITAEPIPVVPAAHYMVGGVATDGHGCVLARMDHDEDGGANRKMIRSLYAIGEVASTGFHGANRLASNSLLEAVVFAYRAFEDVKERWDEFDAADDDEAMGMVHELPLWDSSDYVPIDENVLLTHDLDEIKRLMWNYVGIVRNNLRLERAIGRLKLLEEDVAHYYWHYLLTEGLIELRNIILVARLVVEASMARNDNIGLYYNLDNR